MTADERVQEKPAPTVYLLKQGKGGVRLGGRCRVPNQEYWTARCDMLELMKKRFDDEPSVSAAHPRQEVAMMGGQVPAAGSPAPGGTPGA